MDEADNKFLEFLLAATAELTPVLSSIENNELPAKSKFFTAYNAISDKAEIWLKKQPEGFSLNVLNPRLFLPPFLEYPSQQALTMSALNFAMNRYTENNPPLKRTLRSRIDGFIAEYNDREAKPEEAKALLDEIKKGQRRQ